MKNKNKQEIRTEHTGNKVDVTIIETYEGLIIDIYDKQANLINTHCYFEEDLTQ